jgi:glycosyltransferase involved in cell wall biosynthesis
LAGRGHSIAVVCRPGSWIADQFRGDPVEVVLSDLHRWPPDELRRIRDLARHRRTDVIHTHMSRANFFGVLLRAASGIPCVATAHSRHFQLHWRFNDLVIAVSEATRQYHRRWNRVRPDRIITVPNFLEPAPAADPTRPRRQLVRAELGIGESGFLVGQIGDVIPRKGLLHLVRALPRILARVPNTTLAIIAEFRLPSYLSRVKEAIAELQLEQHVVWMGPHNDVADLLPALDLCVLPSLEESMPLSLLEAMQAGLPVVATSVGGIPECVRHDVTGLLVPPADERALADAVLAMLSDSARRIAFSTAACREIQERFSLDSVVPRIEAALAGAASGGRGDGRLSRGE